MLSTLHHDANIDDSTGELKKPEMIMFYNMTKGGVDMMDEMTATYNCARNSRRWPMVIFYSLLNIGAINSQIIHFANGNASKVKSRRHFLKTLSLDLIERWSKFAQMVETRSGKMQDPAQERIKAEESAKPQPGATIGRDASSDPVVLNPNIDIPKYDGTEDPCPWIESLEEIGFLYHWADYIISRYAAMNMIGSAKTWLNLHKISFTSWENFKSRLVAYLDIFA
ncbi:hypothetical protein LAZ67_18001114 [Cordylochernes scorpioides]|uniref:PiggyBac transposable element-derived protein domain-containing protein n=1 Tax=Cordylochernes scorpioides TaxID=51811 RepID=A0ABY6LFU7_9ARAC|nr:hypothetical protein LAZ67_18001114 [Cordylochernes scorpioides]